MRKAAFDRQFYRQLLYLAVPIAVQQLLKALMYFIDNIMIGSLGEEAIVGVGNANQIAFFVFVLMFGITSAGWVFAARFNGGGDAAGVKNTLGITLAGTVFIGFVFFMLALTIPESLISIFSGVPGVVKSGGAYIRIVGVSYLFSAVSQSYASILRGCKKTRLPMITGFISVCVNALLNYVLIFGRFGFPEMGVTGAAVGTATASILDAVLIVVISYARGSEVKAGLKELFPRDSSHLLRKFVKVGTPIFINESLWALYAMSLVALYNIMGLETAAAMMVFSALDRLAYVVYMGISNTSGIMIGNKLGEGDRKGAYAYAKRFLIITPLSTVAVGAVILALLPVFLAQYDISISVFKMVKNVVYIYTGISWLVTLNITNIVGVMRSGGDTNFAAAVDLAGSLLITVPVAYALALAAGLPVYLVYLAALLAGEGFKLVLGLARFKSRRWMLDITPAMR